MAIFDDTDKGASTIIHKHFNLSAYQIKSNQIALLAKAPLIRSTGAPSTGLQLPDMKQYNAYKQEVKKT